MTHAPLLIEIGAEEIPARMIDAAGQELRLRLLGLLQQAGLEHGGSTVWTGPRRLAVRVEQVAARQPAREERVLGPPAAAAWGPDGSPTAATVGFARKHGLDLAVLERLSTERGEYVGLVRRTEGRTLEALLCEGLPRAIESMPFPKTMRWGEGTVRWVRPVHWILALHGEALLPLELFGVRAAPWSAGHRFLGAGRAAVTHPDRYLAALAAEHVLADPQERRARLAQSLDAAAAARGGRPVEDDALLAEVAGIVEWPGTVAGSFDAGYLDLPRELLITTLRHHQKCFAVQDAGGALLPAFVAVANTDRDPGSHIRRGNEWVIGGRLEDARFFWNEDRKLPLAARAERLAGVVFHARVGTFADKARRLERLTLAIAGPLGLSPSEAEACRLAAALCKCDLVTGTVGEFPELQGRIGGLLLEAEGVAPAVARAVYAHHQPAGADDPVPPTREGRVVSLADKLDSTDQLLRAGERPTGSKDPLGLRRAATGIVRILLEGDSPLTLGELGELAGGNEATRAYLEERAVAWFREQGFSQNEIQAVLRPRVGPDELARRPLAEIASRLAAIRTVRERQDFRSLVKLTERVDTILVRNAPVVAEISTADTAGFVETEPAACSLRRIIDETAPRMRRNAEAADHSAIIDELARFVEPVERFFADVLVIDANDGRSTRARYDLLLELRDLLTHYFDIRELAGQAERRPS